MKTGKLEPLTNIDLQNTGGTYNVQGVKHEHAWSDIDVDLTTLVHNGLKISSDKIGIEGWPGGVSGGCVPHYVYPVGGPGKLTFTAPPANDQLLKWTTAGGFAWVDSSSVGTSTVITAGLISGDGSTADPIKLTVPALGTYLINSTGTALSLQLVTAGSGTVTSITAGSGLTTDPLAGIDVTGSIGLENWPEIAEASNGMVPYINYTATPPAHLNLAWSKIGGVQLADVTDDNTFKILTVIEKDEVDWKNLSELIDDYNQSRNIYLTATNWTDTLLDDGTTLQVIKGIKYNLLYENFLNETGNKALAEAFVGRIHELGTGWFKEWDGKTPRNNSNLETLTTNPEHLDAVNLLDSIFGKTFHVSGADGDQAICCIAPYNNYGLLQERNLGKEFKIIFQYDGILTAIPAYSEASSQPANSTGLWILTEENSPTSRTTTSWNNGALGYTGFINAWNGSSTPTSAEIHGPGYKTDTLTLPTAGAAKESSVYAMTIKVVYSPKAAENIADYENINPPVYSMMTPYRFMISNIVGEWILLNNPCGGDTKIKFSNVLDDLSANILIKYGDDISLLSGMNLNRTTYGIGAILFKITINGYQIANGSKYNISGIPSDSKKYLRYIKSKIGLSGITYSSLEMTYAYDAGNTILTFTLKRILQARKANTVTIKANLLDIAGTKIIRKNMVVKYNTSK